MTKSASSCTVSVVVIATEVSDAVVVDVLEDAEDELEDDAAADCEGATSAALNPDCC